MCLFHLRFHSYFTCCESDRGESVIDSFNDDGHDIRDNFENENERSWSRNLTQEQSNYFLRSEIDPEKAKMPKTSK